MVRASLVPALHVHGRGKETHVKIAVPRMGDNVAPCLEYCATMSVFTVEDNRVVDQLDFPLRSEEPLDRVRLLRDQKVGVIICGGVQDIFESMVRAHGIKMIAWVTGSVDDLLNLYLRGQLVAESDSNVASPPGTSRAGNQHSGHLT